MQNENPSFMCELCLGRIQTDLLFPFPSSPEEDREMLETVVGSVDDLLGPHAEDFRTWDRAGEMPASFVDELKDFGLFSLVIPEEHGGLGFGATGYSRTLQQIGRHDASVGVTVGAHSSIGMRGLLLYGTDAQKERYLEDLASGELIAAFCLTEPGAGSDAASIRTTAVRDGDDWVISGQKLWITNGGIARFFTVFAKTGAPDERRRMTAFIVTTDMPGVTIGTHEDKMGLRASSTTGVFFDEVRVSAEHLLGEEGQGFKVAMHILNSGRTGLAGGCVGGMKKLIELSSAQAAERRQFGRPIAEFGMIKAKLGQMVVDCYAAEAAVHVVNGLIDRGGQDYAVEAAIAKVFSTEALWRAADEALQIAGGLGYMSEYPYERVVRDSRINRIFEGTNEVLRLFIGLTAMNHVGANLSALSSSLRGIFDDPIKGFGLKNDYARRRVALATGMGVRTPRIEGLAPSLQEAGTRYENAVRQLAMAVDRVLRKHGKHIIGKQFATGRLANIMIDLFVLGAVLSRVQDAVSTRGTDACARELEILDVFSRQSLRRVGDHFARIDDNEDEAIKSLADDVVEHGSFRWDTL